MYKKIKGKIPVPVKQIIKKPFYFIYEQSINRLLVTNKQKVFCIGKNKTGTTSMKAAMQELGYIVGNQRNAELLLEDYAKRDFRKLIKYCETAQFFQDFPFSKPYSFVILDYAFPGSKFILTIRDSPEQWYRSLTRFHAKIWGKNGRIPTKEDLQNATYIYKGRPWRSQELLSDTPEDDPYNKDLLIKEYVDYNDTVKNYFKHRPDDLLILNVAEKGAYRQLTEFLGLDLQQKDFPWKNKT